MHMGIFLDENHNYNNIVVKDIDELGLLKTVDFGKKIYFCANNTKEGIKFFNGYNYLGGDVLFYRKDLEMINELQNRQKYVSNTLFPYGIVLRNSLFVGQLIPFYFNSVTLSEAVISGKVKDLQLLNIYENVLSLIKEMLSVGIVYMDIHEDNIMLSSDMSKVFIVDFESEFISFDTNYIDATLCNYTIFVNRLNYLTSLAYLVGSVDIPDTIDDAMRQNELMIKKLKK